MWIYLKKDFTSDQIAGIAKHFGISIDPLMGNHTDTVSKTSPHGVSAFLVEIIENRNAKYTTVKIEEEVYEPSEDCNVFNCFDY